MNTFRKTRALRITTNEATTLLDAMDGISTPFSTWEEHDELARRLRDLITWMEAE